MGDEVHESTSFYWPEDEAASFESDYFCLAVTLLEVTEVHTPRREPSLDELRECANKLKNPDFKAFVLELLPEAQSQVECEPLWNCPS